MRNASRRYLINRKKGDCTFLEKATSVSRLNTLLKEESIPFNLEIG
jgi:hypothetical protein